LCRGRAVCGFASPRLSCCLEHIGEVRWVQNFGTPSVPPYFWPPESHRMGIGPGGPEGGGNRKAKRGFRRDHPCQAELQRQLGLGLGRGRRKGGNLIIYSGRDRAGSYATQGRLQGFRSTQGSARGGFCSSQLGTLRKGRDPDHSQEHLLRLELSGEMRACFA
jgi:hypothetical protein